MLTFFLSLLLLLFSFYQSPGHRPMTKSCQSWSITCFIVHYFSAQCPLHSISSLSLQLSHPSTKVLCLNKWTSAYNTASKVLSLMPVDNVSASGPWRTISLFCTHRQPKRNNDNYLKFKTPGHSKIHTGLAAWHIWFLFTKPYRRGPIWFCTKRQHGYNTSLSRDPTNLPQSSSEIITNQ